MEKTIFAMNSSVEFGHINRQSQCEKKFKKYQRIPAEDIMRNARLEEAQAGIKIAGRNIDNLKHADDTTLMAESEELKSLLMKVKEESEKKWLKTQHSEN